MDLLSDDHFFASFPLFPLALTVHPCWNEKVAQARYDLVVPTTTIDSGLGFLFDHSPHNDGEKHWMSGLR